MLSSNCVLKKITIMKNRLKHRVRDGVTNLNAITLDKKYLVIESDDWGSIRTPNLEILKYLQANGDAPQSEAFIWNDSLETEEDLSVLFDLLHSFRDSEGNALAITANFAMANADFDLIKQNGEYQREPFYETYKKHQGNSGSLKMIKRGIEERVFMPQLHCLEHLRVTQWMEALARGDEDVITAANLGMYGIGRSHTKQNRFGYMDAFNYSKESDKQYLSEAIRIGCQMFEETFGFKSKTFVASCFVWDEFLESVLLQNGIQFIQSSEKQILPDYHCKGRQYSTIRHYTGEVNSNGQIYTVRNCAFEPSFGGSMEWRIDRCFEQIDFALSRRIPAIVSTHRMNFIGSLHLENRQRCIDGLKILMPRVIDKHPDVRFLTSDQLCEIIDKSTKE